MKDLDITLARAQENLNHALAEYENNSATLAREFRELKLQACIFQYEICAEMVGLTRNRPVGFAASIALKGLIHRLYEYDQLMSKHLANRLLVLAKARGVPVDGSDLKAVKRQWKQELMKLQRWADIRNETTGHYGKNIGRQVELLKTIAFDEVMEVTQAFLQFNMEVLRVMNDAGAGNGT